MMSKEPVKLIHSSHHDFQADFAAADKTNHTLHTNSLVASWLVLRRIIGCGDLVPTQIYRMLV